VAETQNMHTFAVGVHMLVLQNDALSICYEDVIWRC